ncbi:MAG TPA: TrbI/VirB10 family protein [Candidatus Sulfotelmatobacter sp.]|nr:TrbI/VirB10 family protein [Candidatus Sulfotelmatobacter sp.]
MEHQEPRTKPLQQPAATGENQSQATTAESDREEPVTPTPLQRFRALLDSAQRSQNPVASRRELGRDKSKSLFVLVGASVALLLLFFGLFSSPKNRGPLPGETARGGPSLGRKVAPGQEQGDPRKAVTPLLSADVNQGDVGSGSQVTAEDIGGTSPRYKATPRLPGGNATALEKPSPAKPRDSGEYALKNVDFSDPEVAQTAAIPNPPALHSAESDSSLKKPSLVFVRAAQSATPALQSPRDEDNTLAELLPAGTRLVARLEAPVSSAVPAPVIAVVEYNYEHNGEIVLPAGARVFGKLSRVTPSGIVGFQFDRLETPDGMVEKIDATAMDLKFGPLKGDVSGRNRGKNFLVRSVTGIGTVAAYIVGGQGTTGFNGPISENSLLRERLADNIGMAGQDQINTLAANQSIVVTVPGNTRFYIVVEKGNSDQQGGKPGVRPTEANSASLTGGKVPSLEELRELLQLKNELNQMYLQTSSQQTTAQQ